MTSPFGDGNAYELGGARGKISDDLAFGITANPNIPLSDWAIYFGIFLIVAFSVFRFRRRLA